MELFTMYSLPEIIAFLVVLGSSLVGFLKFISFIWGYISKFLQRYLKKYKQEEEQKETVDELLNAIKNIDKKLTHLEEQVGILKESDKDDIKSYITEKYHFYVYQQHWIDDYALESIKARYGHYKEEGGNSFIEDLMKEISALPKEPPKE